MNIVVISHADKMRYLPHNKQYSVLFVSCLDKVKARATSCS